MAPPPDRLPQPQYAAVDLGSNSFHMLIARVVDDELLIVDRLREPVRLAAGFDENNRLRRSARERALECLDRFGHRLADVPRSNVRVVGTNTLRKARNTRSFLRHAEEALRHPIEIISGQEEARLVYLGVAHDLSDDGGRRLVVDIGGGSTECVIGRRFEPLLRDSLHMGCVSFSQRYFDNGELTRERFRAAELAAGLELQGLQESYRALGWEDAAGSSGTINSIGRIIDEAGWEGGGITYANLKNLRREMIAAGHIDQLVLPGLTPDRTPVLAGGLAILKAIFSSLRIERMQLSSFALREGLLYDLIGRIRHEDVRDRTIQRMQERYQVDRNQASRIERTAIRALRQVAAIWELDEEQAGRFLSWAAQLHEIGLALNHSGYHKHGAYLVANSDLPGFSRDDQELLAVMVRAHRRKLTKQMFAALGPGTARKALQLTTLLRLSVLLHRSRRVEALPPLVLRAARSALALDLPPGWLDAQPLARADLAVEASQLAAVGFDLRVGEIGQEGQ
ncbi:exopolyphosphatase [Engelhardtia mirabilis]|uniref:Exopolyphosphatase n=1 Tax=Engelhardtia mirabilis TaxID=2528011 RepID=A0A518BJU0_9BACT|nr:Exopolyphosphatase [Planctomycetes bacterium Pla133]QDV01568.1 Exopolyphosphatase [Planctomycetes bacterium Pla86]